MTDIRTRAFDSTPHAATEARRWCRTQLADLLEHPDADLLADVELVVSELVTNACRAVCENLSVSITVAAGVVAIVVHDDAPGRPTPRQAELLDSDGRGLAIVAAIARNWGVRGAAAGKDVWADLPLAG